MSRQPGARDGLLEKAIEVHDPSVPYLGLRLFDPLRADPRFQELLRRIGLPQP